jgi:MazG family protein
MQEKSRYEFADLVAIMARLRSDQGCPWDREQTLATLRPYLLEEAYEVLEAIDGGDHDQHCEELGDVLMQIVFQSQVAAEEEWFEAADVVDAISRKLIRRHPHVFADETAQTSQEVLVHWERIKREEKKAKTKGEDPRPHLLDGVPKSMPALLTSQKLSERAARVGFDWEKPSQVLDKVHEEMGELEEALQLPAEQGRDQVAWELGDLLFSLSNLARHLGLDSENCLREANTRFRQRFAKVEDLAQEGQEPLDGCSIDRLEQLWQAAKQALKSSANRGL